jgi:flagellar basal body-associated protein FliL
MNKSFSTLLIIIILFVLAAMAYWFLTSQIDFSGENSPVANIVNNVVPNTSSENNVNQNQPSNENILATDDFSLTYPTPWRQVSSITGVSAMLIRVNENITNPAAKKMNFQTYLAVSYDFSEGKTKEQVVEYLKNELYLVLPEAIFSQENFLTINGREAYATEITFRKSGLDFRVLEVVVWGNENDLWVLSYNTLEELWQDNVSDFEKMTKSFIVK